MTIATSADELTGEHTDEPVSGAEFSHHVTIIKQNDSLEVYFPFACALVHEAGAADQKYFVVSGHVQTVNGIL